jgi:phosphopantetheinyl transferase (holo-ACP synthase)
MIHKIKIRLLTLLLILPFISSCKKDEDKAESESNLKGLKELLKAIKELDPKDFKDVEDMKKFVAKFFAKNEELRKALGLKLGKDIEVKKEEPKKVAKVSKTK